MPIITLLITSLGFSVACTPFFGDWWHPDEFERVFVGQDEDVQEIEVELSDLYGDGLDYVCVLSSVTGHPPEGDPRLTGNLSRVKTLIASRYRNYNTYDFRYILVAYTSGVLRYDRVHVASRYWAFAEEQIFNYCFDSMQANASILRTESGHRQGGLYYVLSIVSDEA